MKPISDRLAGTAVADAIDALAQDPLPDRSGLARIFSLPAVGARELRLDLFRGLALWLIFIDHASPDLLSWFTIRSYGFSDAAEIFIFISGYTAAFVYGRSLLEFGFMIAAARILRRVWQIYAAHILLFTIMVAEVSWIAISLDKPFYAEEVAITDFFKQPGIAMVQALLLRYRPLNMDVLPLYIVLMACLPLILLLMRWSANLTLAMSVVLYTVSLRYDLHFTTYPNGFWSFNPFAWQMLFVFGAWCALGGAQRLSRWTSSRVVIGLAFAYIVFAFCIAMTWYFPRLGVFVPKFVGDAIYPIDKTNLDVLRILHFLSLAVITVWFVPRDWYALKWPVFRPAIVTGQHSLEIFCLGVFLAFAAHFLFTEVSNSLPMQIIVSLIGIVIMVGVASLISWYRRAERQRPGPRPPTIKPGYAGGDV